MLMSVTQAKFEQKGVVYSLTIHFLTSRTFFFFTYQNSLAFNVVTTKRLVINLLFYLMNFYKQGINLYPKKQTTRRKRSLKRLKIRYLAGVCVQFHLSLFSIVEHEKNILYLDYLYCYSYFYNITFLFIACKLGYQCYFSVQLVLRQIRQILNSLITLL